MEYVFGLLFWAFVGAYLVVFIRTWRLQSKVMREQDELLRRMGQGDPPPSASGRQRSG